MNVDDTIVAFSSAVGSAARLILRLSGDRARALAQALCPQADCRERAAQRTRLRLGAMECGVWLYIFCSPRSYSGQDLVEFHLPGNVLLGRMLLDELVKRGARPAEAGEFTARAFFSGRIDLAEAEGVAAAIAAQNDAELRAARQLLAGELARRLAPAMEKLTQTLALVEVGIDFSEEDLTLASAEQIGAAIAETDQSLRAILQQSTRWERLSHEVRAVLVGRPNAGKSTLLNALAGQSRAIVSPQAGTTRDVLYAQVVLERGIIRLADAAGLDPAAPGPLQVSMRRQALREIEAADLVLLVHDLCSGEPVLAVPRPVDLLVFSKLDAAPSFPSSGTPGEGQGGGRASSLAGRPPPLPSPGVPEEGEIAAVAVSALTGENMAELRRRLDELAFGSAVAAPTLALSARHVQAIQAAQQALQRAALAVDAAEILALELREALDALGSILGRLSTDDLLGRIFASFCIGK